MQVAIAACGGLWRPLRNPKLAEAFWGAKHRSLYVVQVDPLHFPAPISKSRRRLIDDESARDGRPTYVALVWVRQNEAGEPFVAKVKNLPNM